jgi:hypothetical protein
MGDRRRVGAAVAALAALALLALLFATWFRVRPAPTGQHFSPESGILNLLQTFTTDEVRASGWDVLGGLELTPMIATALVALALPVAPRVAYAALALGIVTFAVLAVRIVDLGDDVAGARVAVAASAYAALACALLVAAGAWAARPAAQR